MVLGFGDPTKGMTRIWGHFVILDVCECVILRPQIMLRLWADNCEIPAKFNARKFKQQTHIILASQQCSVVSPKLAGPPKQIGTQWYSAKSKTS